MTKRSLSATLFATLLVCIATTAHAGRSEDRLVTIRTALAGGAGASGYCWLPGYDANTYVNEAFPTKSRVIARAVVQGIELIVRSNRDRDRAVLVAAAKLREGIASGQINAGSVESTPSNDLHDIFLELGYFAGLDYQALVSGN